jgi:hypothetical protein
MFVDKCIDSSLILIYKKEISIVCNKKERGTQAYSSLHKLEEKKEISAEIRLMRWSRVTPRHLYIFLE